MAEMTSCSLLALSGHRIDPKRTSSGFQLHAPTAPLSLLGAGRQIAQARPEARQREIQEGAQFDRHEAIGRVNKTDGYRRRMKIIKQRCEQP